MADSEGRTIHAVKTILTVEDDEQWRSELRKQAELRMKEIKRMEDKKWGKGKGLEGGMGRWRS